VLCPRYPTISMLARPPTCRGESWNGKHDLKAVHHILASRAEPKRSVDPGLNSVSGLVSEVWYRIPLDKLELSILKIPSTDSPTVRPGSD